MHLGERAQRALQPRQRPLRHGLRHLVRAQRIEQAAQRLRTLPGCGPGMEPGRHLGLLAALAPVLQVVHDVQLEVLQPQADAARPAGAGTAQGDMAQRQGAPQVPEPAGLQGVVGGHGRAHCPSQATAEVAVAADGDLPLRSACVPSWSTCPWPSSATR